MPNAAERQVADVLVVGAGPAGATAAKALAAAGVPTALVDRELVSGELAANTIGEGLGVGRRHAPLPNLCSSSRALRAKVGRELRDSRNPRIAISLAADAPGRLWRSLRS